MTHKWKYLVVLLWIPVYYTESNLEPRVKAQVMVSILRRFKSGCLFLLYSSESKAIAEDAELIKVRKAVSELWVTSGMQPLHHFNQMSARTHCCHNRPVNVILDSGRLLKVLPGAVWVQFFNKSLSIISDIQVSFDSEFLVARSHNSCVSLTEVYRIAPGRSINEVYFGNWTAANGLISVDGGIVSRREDLYGAVIRVISAEDPPVTVVNADRAKVGGFFGDVWEILQQKMNFRTKLMAEVKPMDRGNCSGLLGAVQCEKADVALHAFATSSYPKAAVHFSMPLLYTRYRVFIKKPNTVGSEWGAYLAPFSPQLWWVLVFTIVFISCYLAVLYNIGCKNGNEEAVGPRIYGLYDSLLYMYGAFCQQGHEVTPRSMSCRFVYITAYVTALVLMAAYSAALISSLTVYNPNLPFQDLEGILGSKFFQFGVLANSELNYIMMNDEGLLGKIYSAFIEPHNEDLPVTHLEGLQRVCRGDYAFMTSQENVLPLLDRVPCKILQLPFQMYPITLSPAFVRGYPYQELFKYRLQQLQENGIMHRLRVLHWQLSSLLEVDLNPSTVAVHLEAVVPLLVLLSGSIVLSLLLVFVEHGWFTMSMNRALPPRARRNLMRQQASATRHKIGSTRMLT